MINRTMIRANINPDVEILERDKNAYHFRWVNVRINPADPTHPIRKTQVIPIRKSDYNRYFAGKSTEELIRRFNIIGAEDVELVHDPSKPLLEPEDQFSKVEVKEIKTDEQKVTEARKAEEKIVKEKATRTRSSRVKPQSMES